MFEFVHKVIYNSKEDVHSGFELKSTCTSYDEELIKQIEQVIQDDFPIIIIDARVELPPFWEQRLLQPMVENTEIDLITSLNVTNHQLSPIAERFNGSLAQLDHTIYLLQNAQYFQCELVNKQCFAFRSIEHIENNKPIFAVNNLVIDSAKESSLTEAPQFPDTGDQHPLPAHPLAPLHFKLEEVKQPPSGPNYPVLDIKPVALHVVMDWGGGVHQWVNDFIENHTEYNHFILVSHGEFFRHQHGEQFSLHWGNTAGLCIDQYHLSDPIISTEVHHPEYAVMLGDLINQWSIQLIVVSSMIGHAMDCLNTGLPTLRLLHDYFPHWPLLNACLDAEKIDSSTVKGALSHTSNEPFGKITAEQLTQWQQAQNNFLALPNIKIVAPDSSVKTNLLKLPNADVFKKTIVIPHATNQLDPINYQTSHSPFTVLILGRISQPKGQELIKSCVEKLQENKHINFVLLGAGINGKAFESYQNTQVIKDYSHNDLTKQLNHFSPQLALLASTASETFSYTLSELLMSGIPVLATNSGAFKSRIVDGENGVLVEVDAESIVNKIVALSQNTELLNQLHKGALNSVIITQEANKSAYQKLIDYKPKHSEYKTQGLLTPLPLARAYQDIRKNRDRLEQNLISTQENLLEKTQWAKGLSDQNKHLEKNLILERKEISKLSELKRQQAEVYEKEISNINQENDNLKVHLKSLNAQLEEVLLIRSELVEQKAQVESQLQLEQQQIKELRTSRSWRYTKPLRKLTTYARHKRNALRFRVAQLKGLPKRVVNSLRTRGVKQTALIAKNKLKKPAAPQTATATQITSSFDTIHIQSCQAPLASIIIPVYNEFKHTYHCLASISQLNEETPFEVIVIDDCSTDETETQIQNIKGIKYHRQKSNGGFIESCNTGAALATGQYLVFLNNDTEVLEGWLDELIKTYSIKANTGLVGSQLLYPDGRLQEAGGIVFSDASGWNYGRMESPDEPEFQHLREVSYISGASIMIDRKLFKSLGRFDTRYKPAYYEDTDLAFTVRKAGLKVYYQPLSKVIHFEGISSGTDLSSGTKKYQVINQQKFLEKWHKELKFQPAPGSDIETARFQNRPPRVLIFDACTPTPDQDSGSLRMLNLIQIFIELGHQVSFVPENMAHFEHYTEDLQRLGVNCIFAPKYNTPVDYLKTNGKHYDTIILSRYYVAEPLMAMLRGYCPKAKVWFDTVDLHYLREARMAELNENSAAQKAAKTTKQKELDVANGCDLTLVVSPYEKQVLAAEQPDLEVAVLSNIHQVFNSHSGYENSKDLLFIGGYQHTPNVDGLLWFVECIFPVICAAIPHIVLHVVGSKAPQKIIDLGKHPNIEYHGFVEDIEPMMQNIRIAVAPLRFGAGVKGKVNMSMSYGQPVVGTKVAVEGMYTTHGQDVMMADDAESFAQQVVSLYQNPKLWKTVSQGGVKNVEKWFSFGAAKKVITELLS